jgi:hypothetical protein
VDLVKRFCAVSDINLEVFTGQRPRPVVWTYVKVCVKIVSAFGESEERRNVLQQSDNRDARRMSQQIATQRGFRTAADEVSPEYPALRAMQVLQIPA